MTATQPCPHCATIGALAAATKDALDEIRAHVVALTTGMTIPPPTDNAASQTPRLTRQETRVLQAIADGHTPAEIAAQLNLSPHTVKSHTRRALRHLGARDRAHAIAIAYRAGLIGGGW